MTTTRLMLLLGAFFLFTSCTNGLSTGPEGISEATLKEQWEQKKQQMDAESFEISDDSLFVVVEQPPQIKGGLAQLSSLIKYPSEAIANNIEGRVFVQFVVDKEGKVRAPQLLRGIGYGCDESALLAVSELAFTPGFQRGEPVAVRYSLPIVFKLQDS